MTLYWLPIDKNNNHSSYEEIKFRLVVAIGWKNLGCLQCLKKDNPAFEKQSFKKLISLFGNRVYSGKSWWENADKEYAPDIFWNFFNIKNGDILIAIEGTQVKGFCQIIDNVKLEYLWQECYEYAHCIAKCIKWVDWAFDYKPQASSKGFKGIKKIQKEKKKIIDFLKSENLIQA